MLIRKLKSECSELLGIMKEVFIEIKKKWVSLYIFIFFLFDNDIRNEWKVIY